MTLQYFKLDKVKGRDASHMPAVIGRDVDRDSPYADIKAVDVTDVDGTRHPYCYISQRAAHGILKADGVNAIEDRLEPLPMYRMVSPDTAHEITADTVQAMKTGQLKINTVSGR